MTQEGWKRERAVGVHDERARQFAEEYDNENIFKSPFRYGRSLVDKRWAAVLSQLPDRAQVLDIGCGTGRYAHLALERGLDVWAIEPSREMRERAAASISSERLSDASVIDLPFDDGRFSFAYQIEVLRYLDAEDNNKAHREILRVLKPGGWYFGTYVNCFALDGYWFKVAFARVKARMRGSIPENHVEFETPSALKRKLVDCGFADVEIHGAMWAPLRILFKVSPPVGEYVGRKLLKFDEVLSDTGTLRAFAGHLVVIARR